MKKQLLTLLLIPLSLGLVFCSGKDSQSETNYSEKNTPEIAQSEGDQQWRLMTENEQNYEVLSLINHKMGIGALNQLALEGFISYDCEKSFYINDAYGGFQSLMRIKCNSPTGASSAISFNEVRVIFNRFEGNIENFEIQRIGEEVDQSTFPLPD